MSIEIQPSPVATEHGPSGFSRRAFLGTTAAAPAIVSAALGGGFMLGFATQATAQGSTAEINAWVLVHPDDRVVIRIARSEMGQGTLTGLAQLVAEELEADWSKVSTEYPTPGQNQARNRVWGSMSTGGSRGIRESQDYVRKGGAAARQMLIQAAAQEFGAPASECSAANSVVTHRPSGRRLTYGQLAGAAAKITPPAEPTLKDPATWKLAGKRLARLDTVDKTTGAQIYGADLQLPGMLNAAVMACPVTGGTVKSFDAAKVVGMPGVKKVLLVSNNAVAVVADTWWRAKKALDVLPVEWDFGPNGVVQQAGINAMLEQGLTAEQAVVGNSNGNAKEALAGAARKVEAVYAYPYQNHACMEPMNATVRFTEASGTTAARCEAWVPTQNGDAALAALIAASGLPGPQCDVYKINLGGGFGRRGLADYVTQAVLIAKQVPGVPVKMLWSREEDMAQGRYHPITMCKLTAGLDAQGKLQALHMRISGQSILAALLPQLIRDGKDAVVFQGLNNGGGEAMIGYSVPNLMIDHAMRNPHVIPGFWRGVNLNQNAIYLECFIDEIAHATGKDPLVLRRELMQAHPKHLAVLEAAAKGAGWGTPAPDVDGQKVFRGLAQTHGFGSYVAACAEISVSDAGALKVHRIVAATDCGYAVNPQQIEAQVEGSFMYGLSAALYSQCTVKDGRIEQRNFDTYPTMRIRDMPKVQTIVMPSGGFWGGVGEPTIAVAAPAVLNAIFAATGKRIRQLPIAAQSLKRA